MEMPVTALRARYSHQQINNENILIILKEGVYVVEEKGPLGILPKGPIRKVLSQRREETAPLPDEECDFCGERVEYKFWFKIVGRPVDWYVCSDCLETLRCQLSKPTTKEKRIRAPKEAFVFPAYCQFCGKNIEFNPDTWRFEEKVYSLNMLYYDVDICEACRKEMLVAVEKAEKFSPE